MKKVTLIRHAKSKFNTGEYIDDGEIVNCKLADVGILQAKNLNQQFDLIVLSPLKRALATYAFSNIKAERIIVCDLFREQEKSGSFSRKQEIVVIPESNDDIKIRARLAIEYIKNLDSDNIGILSHCVFIWHFLEQLGHEPKTLNNTESVTIHI
jgi:broad specificity phosphatase PhoE